MADIFSDGLVQIGLILLLVTEFLIFLGLWFYRQNVPLIPRKYYPTFIYSKGGQLVKETKSWKVNRKRIPYLRILLKGVFNLPPWKGVEKDIATLHGLNEFGELKLVEELEGFEEANNFVLKEPPLTQREKAEKEILEQVIIPATTYRVKNANGELEEIFDGEKASTLQTKIKNIFAQNSSLSDLNISAARNNYLAQARREQERSKSGDFLTRYEKIIIIAIVMLFSYLMLDNTWKNHQIAVDKSNAVQQEGFRQIVTQCGGVYRAPDAQNQTQQNKNGGGGLGLPFLG